MVSDFMSGYKLAVDQLGEVISLIKKDARINSSYNETVDAISEIHSAFTKKYDSMVSEYYMAMIKEKEKHDS
jgi:hypothetical protein